MQYVPHTKEEIKDMLNAIGLHNVDELFADIPSEALLKRHLNIQGGWDEEHLRSYFRQAAIQLPDASRAVYFLGGGVYDHYVPSVVDRIISLPEFETAYTPYQAEVSQGTLQAMYEYQSLICDLTGMDVTNGSMYDGASAAAEAALMAMRINGKHRIAISSCVNPDILEVLKTYQIGQEFDIIMLPEKEGVTDFSQLEDTPDLSCVVIQSPNYFGFLENMAGASEVAHKQGALFISVVDPISLGILKSPKDYGADIVVGEGQSLGNHMNYGGPHFGFLATKRDFIRSIPGRIAGETVDADGNIGYVLTLQTREQHIRREKATSNITSNDWLMALGSAVYLSLLGGSLKDLGEAILTRSTYLSEQLTMIGYPVAQRQYFFKEFPIKVKDAEHVQRELAAANYFVGPVIDEHTLLVAVTEKRSKEQMDTLVKLMEELQ
ncbi:aminomethyl-transferring glycine dehydrogenase subunit GcvPA [Coprothermobacter platensis]|uniref:aminomethyl-transferring glycine dehydrogenase subunit GcvPA n=1 Tax=Coprothermobacter platensis TaxID=108819 RepID=UPI000370E783|nr:aminomethyl-transferring glycine dehydrogenase subunit GcvPA [Coprothermobacter platensis]